MKKTVIITGSSRGIGAEIARTFANNNYNVVINYFKSKEKAEILRDEITKNGGTAIAVYADIRKEDNIQNLINTAEKTFGNIDVLINNAAICLGELFIDNTIEQYNDVFDTNVRGMIRTSQLVLPKMLTNGAGKIINISSIWGQTGGALEVLYSSSKGAIIAFTKALAKEYALSNITVNSIAPGIIDTDMIRCYTDEEINMVRKQVPMEKIGLPKDIAEMALFLASDKANYITGQIIAVNGGFYC